MQTHMPTKVFVLLADGFEEIEAISPIDVLRRAGIETVSVSISGKKEVCGAHRISIFADVLFEEANFEEASMLILPGGMPGTMNLMKHFGLKEVLISFAKSGKYIAAICAAPMVLGELGLLKEKNAVCYPGFETHLKLAHLPVQEMIYDHPFVTAKGAGIALQFSLKLVELLINKNKAKEIAKKMLATSFPV